MAQSDQNQNPAHSKSAEEEIQITPQVAEKPPSILRALMHVFWIAALFLVFKGLSIYVENNRDDGPAPVQIAATVTVPTAAPAPTPSASAPAAIAAPTSITPTQIAPTTPTEPPAVAPVVQPANAAPSAAVERAISGKAITKTTTCSELKDVLEYWTDIAKKPRTEARGKWLEERIQDVQAQKAALNCK